MHTRKRPLTILLLILASIGMTACTMGSGLFTEEELDGMYQIVVSRDGSALAPGARVSAATELGLSVTGIDGAPEADSVELLLSYPDGTLAASILFSTTDTETSQSIVVKDFETDVPPFTMPEDLPDGYYTLQLRIKNAAGGILSKYSTVVLLYGGVIPTPGFAVYPGTVIAGEVSLIRLEADFPATIDPWIKWTVDGRVLWAGYNSDHADRLAWQAPAASGVYLAKAEIYPFLPPPGFDIAPLAVAEIRLPVSSNALEPDPLSTRGAWSRLTFDGDPLDKGSRIHTENPSALGSPILETYASGFGYLLGNGAGFISTSSLLPVSASDAGLAPFTALFVLARAPEGNVPGTGTLLTALPGEDFPGLVIGIEKGFAYFKSGASTIRSDLELKASVSRLAVYVAPAEGGAFVQFYLDEQPAGNGTFNSTLFQARAGTCIISGKDGYAAIFDELRIIEGAYPAFLLSEKASKGKALVSASGFEGGILGSGFATEGESIELAHGRLILGGDARLVVGSSGIPPQGTALAFSILEGEAMASIKLADGKSLGIDTDGTIWLDGEATGFKAGGAAPSSLSVAVEPTEAGLLVHGSDDSWVLFDDAAPAVDAAWILTSTGGRPAIVSNVSLSLLEPTLASSRRLRLLPANPILSGSYPPPPEIMPAIVEAARPSQILAVGDR